MRATWSREVIAESDDIFVAEANRYFPHESLYYEYFQSSTVTGSINCLQSLSPGFWPDARHLSQSLAD